MDASTKLAAAGTVRRTEAAPAEAVLRGARAHTLVTRAATGWSRYDDLAVTRWTGDPTCDADGFFLYVEDLDDGQFYSAGWQPAGAGAESYDAALSEAGGSFRRTDRGIELRLDVCLTAEDVELRRVTLVNQSGRPRRLAVTSYLEWVLQDAAADYAHPAFSKLFVETRVDAERRLIVARRRARELRQDILTGGHWVAYAEGAQDAAAEFETSRMKFLGRGGSVRRPAALGAGVALSGAAGPVLDPIASVRQHFVLAAGESATIVLALAARRDEAELLAAVRSLDRAEVDDAFAFAEGAPADPPPGALPADGGWSRDGATVGRDGRRFDPAHAFGGADADEFHRLPASDAAARKPTAEQLQFDNGIGGFAAGGEEYVIRLRPDGAGGLVLPPLPWSHVVANPHAGFIATETGAGYTWTANSRENRLTSWHNDPVRDPHSEALYLRDVERRTYWSPMPGPAGAVVEHEVRYGFGWARYEHASAGLRQRVEAFVPPDDSVKITRVTVANLEAEPRQLEAFFFAELSLGNGTRRQMAEIRTEIDAATGAVFAVNSHRDLASRVAFAILVTPGGPPMAASGDRTEFLGLHGETSAPRAVRRAGPLSGRTGAGLDACAALQATLPVPAQGTAECWVLLGEAESAEAARALIARYATAAAVAAALEAVRHFWSETLSGVQIETPAPAVDLMVNGWLPYQNLSCRMWGRSAYYQSGGAFGFRDQLQDSAALVYHWPELTRAQILRNAGSQFVEGDVLHWWHEPNCRGIRTRFADDLLWLPLIAADYCRTTGDHALWDELAPYLRGPALTPDEDERFMAPERSGETGSVYEHACRAIDRSLAVGAHGLPLFGCGDWNDGMNRVGRGGKGESVWMGFFLYHVLERFIPVCAARGDASRADAYREHQTRLRAALNGPGWDGQWFRRAFFGDRTPLGSATSEECQIDALAQAWAVLSGAGDAEFSRKGMVAVERRLVDESAGLIRLLDPPFNRMAHDPGYIKGYLPGIRENGGQYTHGVLWFIRALAEMGRGSRAAELLEMLSPISRTISPEAIARYQAEPYVVAADVYSVTPNVGRAGWTWYTGSAGWMWRVAVESVLGLQIHEGRELVLSPRISAAWPRAQLSYRTPGSGTTYRIVIENPERRESGVRWATCDGRPAWVEGGVARAPLAHDGQQHEITLQL